jgi:GNAT superfamily N-acetyltransferase
MPALEYRVVDRRRWPDLEALVGARGGPSSCWCTVWRSGNGSSGEVKKALLSGMVEEGRPVGVLAYLHHRPVGWCSVAPRRTYRWLGGADYDGMDEARVWSIVCFFVARVHRGEGIGWGLQPAAGAAARETGAELVEACPVSRESPSYRFMGLVDVFERAGFEHRRRAGTRRHVMSLRVVR